MSSISSLPKELIELILAQIPLSELLLSNSLVCRQWRDIIQAGSFLPHRKSYYQYRLRRSDTVTSLDSTVGEQVAVLLDMQGLSVTQQLQNTGESLPTVMLQRCLPWLLNKFADPGFVESLHITADMFANI